MKNKSILRAIAGFTAFASCFTASALTTDIYNASDLKAFRDADISACNADKLVDLSDVKVKRKLPLNRRADDFIAQVGNPYLFRVDDVVVKVEFGDGKDFSEMLTDVIIAG